MVLDFLEAVFGPTSLIRPRAFGLPVTRARSVDVIDHDQSDMPSDPPRSAYVTGIGVDPPVMPGTQRCHLLQPARWGCWTIKSFLPAPRLLFGVFAEETYRGAGKEDHERKPQHKQNNLKDPLALIEEPIPRK